VQVVRHVELALTSKSGKVLFERKVSIPDSGSISLGRSSIFDETCDYFSPNEWAVVTVSSDFVCLSSSFSRVFGIGRAELSYRRNRKLVCSLLPRQEGCLLGVEGKFSFTGDEHLKVLPEVTGYLDPGVRSVIADLLINEDIFDENGLVQEFVSPRFLANGLSSRIHSICNIDQSPKQKLEKFISVFWILASYVYAEGPVTRWVRSQETQEILFNGFRECWLERKGSLERQVSPFVSWDDLHAWLSRFAMLAGVELASHRGCADFALPCGARVHVAHSPVARREGYVSIRCHRERGFSLSDLLMCGAMTAAQAETMESWVANHKNILVAGATSSGKTTLVRALLESVPHGERIVVLEDVPELSLKHDHVVYLQTFESIESEMTPSIGLESLVREALRMRPDRIVVGECRGNEAFALVQALHTGHRGSISTVHANSARDALTRLETLMIRAEPSLDARAVQSMIRGAFDAVIFVERDPAKGRRVSGLHLVQELLVS
jgi:Flp pilus assembly CpaF family ATPase